MSRRSILQTGTASLAAASLLALTACGGSDEQAEAWILTGGGWDAIAEDLDRFNESSDEQINVEAIENDAYKQQIRTAVGSGDAPTMIMSWTGGALLEYVNEERVVPLDDHVGELEQRVHDSVWQNGVVDDSVYAVPLNDVQPAVLYYNQDVLDEHGLSVPETWSDMESIIDTLDGVEDVDAVSVAGGSVWPALMWLQYLTDRHGGEEVFTSVVEGEEDAWDDESIIYALETIQQLGGERLHRQLQRRRRRPERGRPAAGRRPCRLPAAGLLGLRHHQYGLPRVRRLRLLRLHHLPGAGGWCGRSVQCDRQPGELLVSLLRRLRGRAGNSLQLHLRAPLQR